jgi:hypothetical protein
MFLVMFYYKCKRPIKFKLTLVEIYQNPCFYFFQYFNLLSEEDYARGLLPPLLIFPRGKVLLMLTI